VTTSTRTNVAHSLRVAATATAIVALLYLMAVVAFDVIVAHRLISQVDGRLSDRLADTVRNPGTLHSGQVAAKSEPDASGASTDLDDAPVFVWKVSNTGRVVASGPAAPTLPATSWSHRGGIVTSSVGESPFRLDAMSYRGGWLVAGVSLADQHHVQGLLVEAELIAGPIALLGMFLGSFVIGIKASAPVEQARIRQLEFTADASHELRTPLSVIEAEVDLALRTSRDASSYRESLERVKGESTRLRRIVDNLLWLARLDSIDPSPVHEPIDLATIAEVCVARFSTVAESRNIMLRTELLGHTIPWVNASAESIDRLAGVLVDNACRYTPSGGAVQLAVGTRAGRVRLIVEDSGPGIPPEERQRLFDRFHRASDAPGGAGLGLAIADSVVRATGGRWHVGDSPLGGALMEVSWHRLHGRGKDAATREEPTREEHGGQSPALGDPDRGQASDAAALHPSVRNRP
jgi:signal transduction histidine kinase